MKKILLGSVLCIASTNALAMLCPSNFKEIYIGDDIATVIAACGAPNSQNSTDVQPSKPQEYVYFMKENPSDQLAIRVSFAIIEDKVANITVNSVSVGNTVMCGGKNINVGDPGKNVKDFCGAPAVINETPSPPPKPGTGTNVTQLIYMNPNKTVLLFENGKLKSRQ